MYQKVDCHGVLLYHSLTMQVHSPPPLVATWCARRRGQGRGTGVYWMAPLCSVTSKKRSVCVCVGG